MPENDFFFDFIRQLSNWAASTAAKVSNNEIMQLLLR